MAIYKTPYDTTAGLGTRYSHIAQGLKAAYAAGALQVHYADNENFGHLSHGESKKIPIALVQGGNSYVDAIHFFKHPVFIRENHEEVVCLDVREFGKWNAPQHRFDVRNAPEYVWAIKRAILTAIWNEGRIEALRDISNLPAQVYSALVSESIARRFALDPAEQATVAVLAAYFYYSLFSEAAQVPDDEKNALAGKINRVTRIDAQRVFQIIDPLQGIENVQALCEVVQQAVGNVALENLNVGNLFNVVSGNWYGHNSRELVCMSLEHVPTWLLIVEASLNSATFRRSTLAKLSPRFDKQGAGNSFIQSLSSLIGGENAFDDLPAYSTYFGTV